MKKYLWNDEVKNRYYKGKALTSEDFLIEQEYGQTLNHKTNRFAIGKGILQGLALRELNEKQFILSSGCAIDQDGHMLCVEREAPYFIADLAGFDALTEPIAHVYLALVETPVDQTYCALSEDGDHHEYNHIQCSWKLHLENEDENLYNDFFEKLIIYEDQDIKIIQIIPTRLPDDGQFALCVEVLKKKKHLALSFAYVMITNDCVEKEVQIEGNLQDETKRKETFYFPLQRKANFGNTHSTFIIQGNVLIKKQGKQIEIPLHYEHTFLITNHLMADIQNQCLHLGLPKNQQGVYLGTIYMEEKRRVWNITSIELPDIHTYLKPTYISQMQEEIIARYHYQPSLQRDEVLTPLKEQQETSGILCLHDMKVKNDIYYSDEIKHGFGANEVLIETMLQTQNLHHTKKQSVLIQGDMELFYEQKEAPIKMAVQTFLQDGTFQIALQIAHINPALTFIIWKARKLVREKAQVEEMELIRLEPGLVELKPLATCIFTPVFDDPSHVCECMYSLADKQSGNISDDGAYYAPSQCGIYQVEAKSERGEVVYAYVHVVDEPS